MAKAKGISMVHTSGSKAFKAKLAAATQYSALVGIPASGSDRAASLLALAGKVKTGSSKSKRIAKAQANINNAELLFIFSKGSPARNQPARPVLEPAISDPDNAKIISRELAEAVRAAIAGDTAAAKRGIQRTGLAGQNAARKWFTNPKNMWAPNAPSTIARKGSDRPGIDLGAMRAAITYVVEET